MHKSTNWLLITVGYFHTFQNTVLIKQWQFRQIQVHVQCTLLCTSTALKDDLQIAYFVHLWTACSCWIETGYPCWPWLTLVTFSTCTIWPAPWLWIYVLQAMCLRAKIQSQVFPGEPTNQIIANSINLTTEGLWSERVVKWPPMWDEGNNNGPTSRKMETRKIHHFTHLFERIRTKLCTEGGATGTFLW